MTSFTCILSLAAGAFLCLGTTAPAQSPATGKEKEELKLPGATRSLGEYLVNTVWDLEGGHVFRFRGDGTMVMPWHDFEWKPTGKRTVRMFTADWRWDITFSEDMRTLEVPGRYKGKFARRIEMPLEDKALKEILTASTWTRVSKSGQESFALARNGKIQDAAKVWKTWELHHGLLILKGERDGKGVRDEYLLQADQKPYILTAPEGGDRPKLQQQ